MQLDRVKKAVFPVGGMGTRFLPATKATPKEMLPIVDKPLIQYAVEEAVAAGIDTLIFVTGRNKAAIADHFDKAYELEHQLELKNKAAQLATVREIVPDGVDCVYIRQAEALGLGHAVLCAKKAVGNEPFAVLLADDLIDGGAQPCMSQMTEAYERTGRSVIAVQEVAKELTNQYGIVSVKDALAQVTSIDAIVEKPEPAEAPSTLGVVGRYILTPRIFDILENTGKGAGGEYQLTDAISTLLAEQIVNAYRFDGIRYDCGSKEGFIEATLEYALKHPDIKDQMGRYILELAQKLELDLKK